MHVYIDKLTKILLIINALLLLIVLVKVSSVDNTPEIDYDIMSDKVVEKLGERDDFDYERIESIIKDSQEERFKEIEVQMEEKVESKYEELNKDFGEQFEEMTSYFGDKFKETFNNINEKLNE